MDLLKRLSDLVNDETRGTIRWNRSYCFRAGWLRVRCYRRTPRGGYIGALLYGVGLGLVGALVGAIIGWFLFYVLAIGALILLGKVIIWVIQALWGIGRP